MAKRTVKIINAEIKALTKERDLIEERVNKKYFKKFIDDGAVGRWYNLHKSGTYYLMTSATYDGDALRTKGIRVTIKQAGCFPDMREDLTESVFCPEAIPTTFVPASYNEVAEIKHAFNKAISNYKEKLGF